MKHKKSGGERGEQKVVTRRERPGRGEGKWHPILAVVCGFRDC